MTFDATPQANYYEVLGATPMDQLDRIEDLFRQLAYDAETSGDHSRVPLAVEAFKVLRDPATRHQYDQQLAHQQQLKAAQQEAAIEEAQPPQPPAALTASPAAQAPPQQSPPQQEIAPAQEPDHPGMYSPTPSEIVFPPGQLSFSIPNVQSEAPHAQPVEQPAEPMVEQAPEPVPPSPEASAVEEAPVSPAVAPVAPVASATPGEPPEFCAKTAQQRRREVLSMFYKRRRDDAKNPGLAIGGIEQKVDYTYEVLEFHLWFMQQKEWLLRLESGMFTITYPGVEEHEKNLLEGLVK